MREIIRVFQGEELGDFADCRSDFLNGSGDIVVILSNNQKRKLLRLDLHRVWETDLAKQLGSLPTQVLSNQAKFFPCRGSGTSIADIAHKHVQIILEEFRQVLTCEIVEELEQEEQSLREFW